MLDYATSNESKTFLCLILNEIFPLKMNKSAVSKYITVTLPNHRCKSILIACLLTGSVNNDGKVLNLRILVNFGTYS